MTGALSPQPAVNDGETSGLGGSGSLTGVRPVSAAVTAAPVALEMIQRHPVQHCAGKLSSCLARFWVGARRVALIRDGAGQGADRGAAV